MANKIWIIAAAILYACLIGGLLYLNSMREYAESQLESNYELGFEDGKYYMTYLCGLDSDLSFHQQREAWLKFWHKSLNREQNK